MRTGQKKPYSSNLQSRSRGSRLSKIQCCGEESPAYLMGGSYTSAFVTLRGMRDEVLDRIYDREVGKTRVRHSNLMNPAPCDGLRRAYWHYSFAHLSSKQVRGSWRGATRSWAVKRCYTRGREHKSHYDTEASRHKLLVEVCHSGVPVSTSLFLIEHGCMSQCQRAATGQKNGTQSDTRVGLTSRQ
jgi:hypothetical protein